MPFKQLLFYTMDEAQSSQESLQWFAMRDLKRRHAKLPAYKLFESLKVQYFTPMVHRLVVVNGKRVNQEVPFIQDLLFVKDTKEHLDSIVEKLPNCNTDTKSVCSTRPSSCRPQTWNASSMLLNPVIIPDFILRMR